MENEIKNDLGEKSALIERHAEKAFRVMDGGLIASYHTTKEDAKAEIESLRKEALKTIINLQGHLDRLRRELESAKLWKETVEEMTIERNDIS